MSPQLFPHLMPAEQIIWNRFLGRYGGQWDSFDYDVRVGQGHPIDPLWPPEIQDMARRLGPKRIDAIGWVGRQPTIFEVRPAGTIDVIGKLRVYEFLFTQQFPQLPPPHLAGVFARVDPDGARYCQATGIACFAIPDMVPA